MKRLTLRTVVVIGLFLGNFRLLNAQCGSPKCADAEILCSIRELDGITCQALSNPDEFDCNNNSEYVSWWKFLAIGSNSITITPISNCGSNSTLIANLYYSTCRCFASKTITITNTAQTINFNTDDCNPYILSIKNSNNSNCTYKINTIASQIPKITVIPTKINFQTQQIKICPSQCPVNFNLQYTWPDDGCYAKFHWTLDGVFQSSFNGEPFGQIIFPQPGIFDLCVTAHLDPNNSGNSCDQSMPLCIKVISEILGPYYGNSKRNICFEKTPYKWGNSIISQSGIHTSQFSKECCKFDSIVEFEIIYPELPNTNYISCDGTPYIDPITNVLYPECFSKKKIVLQKYQNYGCDNSYYLSTSYPKIKPKWIINNVNGSYEIDPNIQIKDLCDAQIGIESYGWYKKSDPQQTIISKNKKLTVATQDNYCLNYLTTINLGPESQVCSFTFCEPFTQAPTADIISNKQMFCPGTNVTFTEQCSQDAIAWHWELVGADPPESTLRNPTVYYDKSGIYPVKLTVENQYFSSTITKTSYINVIKSPLCNVKEKKKKKFPIGFGPTENELQDRSSELSEIQIMPNPNNGSFQIKGLNIDETYSIEIFDLIGQSIYNKNITNHQSSSYEIIVLDIQNGTYFLKISNDYNEIISKLIICKN